MRIPTVGGFLWEKVHSLQDILTPWMSCDLFSPDVVQAVLNVAGAAVTAGKEEKPRQNTEA